jgi:hypothetical protein
MYKLLIRINYVNSSYKNYRYLYDVDGNIFI